MTGDRDHKNALNIGCGFEKMDWAINVDAYEICKPDVVHDLNDIPWPFKDGSMEVIFAHHVMEHLKDWWAAFSECARILKPGGYLEVRVPDASSDSALCYRDHFHVFSMLSFHGIEDSQYRNGSNAWAATVEGVVPMKLIAYHQVPFPKYNWMRIFGLKWLLRFCADHLRNFIWEQRFTFQKTLTPIGGKQ